MSFLVANATLSPPLWVKCMLLVISSFIYLLILCLEFVAKFEDRGAVGISSGKGHWNHRSKCINDFVEIFGHMPLISTPVRVVDSRSQMN